MITETDLLGAIAECQGQRNPNANTCVKLASYYTILNQMAKDPKPVAAPVVEPVGYSLAPPPGVIGQLSDSEFSRVSEDRTIDEIWPVLDELMDVLKTINVRLYDGVIRRIKRLGEG